MAGETESSRSPIILGRPFMKTAKTKIDVDDGTMSMEFADVYSCDDDCTDTNLCVVCAEINLQGDIFPAGEVVDEAVNEAVYAVEALDIPAEEKLLQVLKQHKKAIGWTLADIPGISPTMCMHR
ncbi:hypothetical protein L195_g057921, partial [Trifolium pratense]